MDNPFHPTTRISHNLRFLSPGDDHHRTLEELNSSIIIHNLPGSHLPSHENLALALVERYGGTSAEWIIAALQGAFLVRLPPWASQEEILSDNDYWEFEQGLNPAPWQTMDGFEMLPTGTTVLISIVDFPPSFWHPTYFRQATASMGVMTGYSYYSSGREDKSKVRVLIQCQDTNLVPPKLYIGHGGSFSECQVILEGNLQSNEGDPPHHPHNHQGGGRDASQYPQNPILFLGNLVRGWRKRRICLPNPFPDLDRGAAPAACHAHNRRWSMGNDCTPHTKQEGSGMDKTELGLLFQSTKKGQKCCGQRNIPEEHVKKQGNTWLPLIGVNGVQKTNPKFNHAPCTLTSLLYYFINPKLCLHSALHNNPHYLYKVYPQAPPYSHNRTDFDPLKTQPKQPIAMSTATEEDDALIQRFIGLSTEDNLCPTISVPQHATSSTNC